MATLLNSNGIGCRRSRPAALVLLIVIFLYPAEGTASGSCSESYGEQGFLLSYDNRQHKIYSSEEQAERIYQEFRQEFFARMEQIAPQLRLLFATARKKKLPLVDIDLLLPELLLKGQGQLTTLGRASFPMLIALPLQLPDDGGRYTVKLALTAPLSQSDLDWLNKKLETILFRREEAAAPAVRDLASYKMPQVTKQHETHALYLAGKFQAAAPACQFFEKQLQRHLDEITPHLAAGLATDKIAATLGVKPVPLARALSKIKRRGSMLFNPYGPILDEEAGYELVRPRYQNPNLIITLLFAAQRGKADPILESASRLLERALAPVGRR